MCKFAEKDVLGGGLLNFDILSRFDFKQKKTFFHSIFTKKSSRFSPYSA